MIAVAFWWFAGRGARSDTLRQASWIFAASQLLVLCVPIALALVKALAIGVVALLAIAGARSSLFSRAPLDLPILGPQLGRSQAVRQRVLVPRSQVRILAPQPSH